MSLLLFICGAILSQAPNIYSSPPKVEINGHQIEGKQLEVDGLRVNQYLGVPYAQPPLGPLRFQKPRPVQEYPSEASASPPACMQYTDKPYPWYANAARKSEDCLYLNIWTPADSTGSQKSVMFWIHSGGFRFGSIVQEVYEGTALAALGDIVVVSVNHRLGSFGFLTTETEDAPLSNGLYDILEGLKWVHRNIGAFGGDSHQITISGQSAGAAAVGDLTASPLAEGLYARLILQSSSAVDPLEGHGINNVLGQKLAEKLGCADGINTLAANPGKVVQCLRGIDGVALARAEFDLLPLGTTSFLPQWGDALLPQDPPRAIVQGNFKCKDALIGTTRDEGSILFTSSNPNLYGFFGDKDGPAINKSTAGDTIRDFITNVFPNTPVDPAAAVAHYLPDSLPEYDGDAIRHEAYTAAGDMLIGCPSVYYAEKCAQQAGVKVYSYVFAHRPRVTPWAEWMGVAHFEEIQFVFGLPLLHPERYKEPEITLSRQMIRVWSSFVKTGTPDESWPLYSKENPKFRFLGPNRITNQTGDGPHRSHCNFLRPYYGANCEQGHDSRTK